LANRGVAGCGTPSLYGKYSSVRSSPGALRFTQMCSYLRCINKRKQKPDIITPVIGVWRSWLARRVWDAEVGGSSPLTPTSLFGDWRSLVARTVRDGEVASSNLASPTID
jgi:hypothetical protein